MRAVHVRSHQRWNLLVIIYNILIMTRTTEDVYQAKFGPSRETLLGLAGCAAFCAVVIVVPTPLWIRVLTFGFFGLGGLVIATASLTFRTAIRVDHAGVMLRRYALQLSSATSYPWEDIQRLLIWKYNRLKRLGIQRREAAPPLPTRAIRPMAANYLEVSAPGVPLDIAATAATAVGWHLNEDRLIRAVARFAPTVEVVDVTGDRTLYPTRVVPGTD